MSAQRRLLPWSEPTGKPCYLLSDADGEGFLSQLADDMEAVQLRMGAELIEHAGALLGNPKAEAGELRFLSSRLVEALRDALRVAESRGGRLPVPDESESDGSAQTEEGEQ